MTTDTFKIETARLIMCPFIMDDVASFSKICTNPNVMRYIGNGQPLDRETVKAQVTNWISLYEHQGYGLLAVRLKENNQLIGFCGLLHQMVDEENLIELGYRLDEKFWGKGLATEAALAIKNYALNQLKIPRLISIIHHENVASKNVASKVGMEFMKRTHFKDVLVDVYLLENKRRVGMPLSLAL